MNPVGELLRCAMDVSAQVRLYQTTPVTEISQNGLQAHLNDLWGKALYLWAHTPEKTPQGRALWLVEDYAEKMMHHFKREKTISRDFMRDFESLILLLREAVNA